jgi:heme-degrading monooxygenase HmoA
VIALVWQIQVQSGREADFERFFGANGAWQGLSRRSRSFLGSSFLRDAVQPRRYIVVEYWSEMVVYEKHQADYSDEVRGLEQERNQLVDEMAALGIFTALDVPDRTGPTWSRRSATP